MSGTARTTSYLLNTDFTLTGASGRIVPQSMDDLVVSGPQWDAVSGVATPYLLRGTLDGAAYFTANGGVLGAGQTTGQRQTNATVLNAAFAYCVTNGKFMELEPAVYEINSSTGLLVPASGNTAIPSGLVFRGSRQGTQIVQYYAGGTGAPILTIGDTTGATPNLGVDFFGINMSYGASQTGLTSSTPLVIGNADHGRIGGVTMITNTNPGYDGILLQTGNYSMTYKDIELIGFQRNGLNLDNAGSSGCTFEDIYLSAGGSTGVHPTVSGNYLVFSASMNEMTFLQLNCEWGACNRIMSINSTYGVKFVDLHIENVLMNGASPIMFAFAGTTATFDTVDLVDIMMLSANMTGSPSVFGDYIAGGSVIRVEGLTWINNATGQINTPVELFNVGGGTVPGDDVPIFTLNKGQLNIGGGASDFAGNILFDQHMPVASFNAPIKWSSYDFGIQGSVVQSAQIQVSATYTHYGQHERATIIVPASITSFTLTLANTMGATGTQAVRTGSTTHVRRLSGGASGTLTVAYGGTSSPTTNTTSATDYWYVFDGTHWQTYTPVT